MQKPLSHQAWSKGVAIAPDRVARMLDVIRTGSSAPAYVEAGDGALYILKLAGAGAGTRGLLTEFLATGIARAIGLAVPSTRPLFLPEDFPWQVGTDEFDDMVRRSYGWNLGIGFIAQATTLEADELGALPAGFIAHLAFADRLLQNVDRTVKNPNVLKSPLGFVAIDFGSCLFLNRIASRRTSFPFALPPNHFLAGTPRAAASPALGTANISDAIAAVPGLIDACPAEWLATLPFGPEELDWRLTRYLEAFEVR
jgi:hypothetical protein